jgi:hypothetical protein
MAADAPYEETAPVVRSGAPEATMTVSERLAARKALNEKARLAKAKAVRPQKSRSGEPHEPPSLPKQTRRRLTEIYEQRVLKKGIRKMKELIAAREDTAPLLDLPKRPNGTSKLMRPTYIEKLLSGQLELQTSLPADVSASQSDLRHLRLEQLLVIREGTLDFATSSASHDTHNGFLSILDRHLFDQLARKHIDLPPDEELPLASEPLFKLGFLMAVTLGAFLTLTEATAPSSDNGDVRPLPAFWALPLEADQVAEWSGYALALLNTTDMKVSLLPAASIQEAAQSITQGGSVGVVWDRTHGIGKDRMLHWEVAAVDLATEDLMDEFKRSQRGGVSLRKCVTAGDLNAVLLRRSAVDSPMKPRSLTVHETQMEEELVTTSPPSSQAPSSSPSSPAPKVPEQVETVVPASAARDEAEKASSGVEAAALSAAGPVPHLPPARETRSCAQAVRSSIAELMDPGVRRDWLMLLLPRAQQPRLSLKLTSRQRSRTQLRQAGIRGHLCWQPWRRGMQGDWWRPWRLETPPPPSNHQRSRRDDQRQQSAGPELLKSQSPVLLSSKWWSLWHSQRRSQSSSR